MGDQRSVFEGRRCELGRRTAGGAVAALLASALVLAGCRHVEPASAATAGTHCEAVSDLPGTYSCSGECVLTDAGQLKLHAVSGETDVIEKYPGAQAELYQVHITAPGFTELEIGALVGTTLRTSTAEVIDNQFPVLEEYVFETDSSCKATGFAKNVRNPSQANFKSCLVHCRKGGQASSSQPSSAQTSSNVSKEP